MTKFVPLSPFRNNTYTLDTSDSNFVTGGFGNDQITVSAHTDAMQTIWKLFGKTGLDVQSGNVSAVLAGGGSVINHHGHGDLSVTYIAGGPQTLNVVHGGGSDHLTVKGAAGTEIISAEGAAHVDIDSGAGGDVITLDGTGTGIIRTGAGNDTINHSLGSFFIDVGTGSDTINYKAILGAPVHAAGVFVNVGSDDTFKILGGLGHHERDSTIGQYLAEHPELAHQYVNLPDTIHVAVTDIADGSSEAFVGLTAAELTHMIG